MSNDIKIEEDPEVPGRFLITMPDPRPTAEEIEAVKAVIRPIIRQELARLLRERRK